MRIKAMLLLLFLLLFALPNVQGFLQSICNAFPNLPLVCRKDVAENNPAAAVYCNANPTNATNSQYDIQFAFLNIPSSDQTFFTKAEKRWQQVLKGDVPDVILDRPISTSCGDSPLVIDDIVICAHYNDIDGPEGILGSAGVIASRLATDGPFPVIGEIRFDVDDVGFLGFSNVIVHEIGHILGIGSTWDKTKPALSNTSIPPCPYEINSKASVEWRCLTGCTNAVPTEENNQGINCINWDEDCLQKEIMTGQTTGGNNDDNGPGGDEILSQITTASLQDIGYLVNYEGAEQFTSDNVLASCRCNNRRLGGGNVVDGRDFVFPQQQRRHRRARSEASLQAKDNAIIFGKQQLAEKAFLSRHLLTAAAAEVKNATTVVRNNETMIQFVQDEWISVFYLDPDTQHVAYVMVRKEDV